MSSSQSIQHLVPKCGWCNQNDGIFTCSRCSDTIPPKVYCSQECQRSDWPLHMKYCGKIAYTFDLTLVDSEKPVIKRTFEIPSWFTFRQLHYTIQYVMGWQHAHAHRFTFFRPSNTRRRKSFGSLSIQNPVLRVTSKASLRHEMDLGECPVEIQETLTLADVYGKGGRLNNLIQNSQSGTMYPLCYLYDFGVNWEHLIEFKGQKLANASRPLVTSVTGRAPLEDAGGIHGWEDFDPFEAPNVIQMNDEGRWEKHVKYCMQISRDNGEVPI